MQEMTHEEMKAFLLSGTRTGKVATVRGDGRPHLAPIWFDIDEADDSLLFTTWHETVKARNLQRDGRISLCVDEETPPFAFVIVEGTAAVDPDPDAEQLRYWATRIAARYMGPDQAAAYGKRNSVPGEWLVRLKPDKWIGRKEIAD